MATTRRPRAPLTAPQFAVLLWLHQGHRIGPQGHTRTERLLHERGDITRATPAVGVGGRALYQLTDQGRRKLTAHLEWLDEHAQGRPARSKVEANITPRVPSLLSKLRAH